MTFGKKQLWDVGREKKSKALWLSSCGFLYELLPYSLTYMWTLLVSLTWSFFDLSQATIGRTLARVHRQGCTASGLGLCPPTEGPRATEAVVGALGGAGQVRVHGQPWRRREELTPRRSRATRGARPRPCPPELGREAPSEQGLWEMQPALGTAEQGRRDAPRQSQGRREGGRRRRSQRLPKQGGRRLPAPGNASLVSEPPRSELDANIIEEKNGSLS